MSHPATASLDAVGGCAHRAYLLGWNLDAPADPDLPIYRSGVPHAPLNGVVRATGLSPRDALAEARRRLDGLPRVWWSAPDSSAGLTDALLALGAAGFRTVAVRHPDLLSRGTGPAGGTARDSGRRRVPRPFDRPGGTTGTPGRQTRSACSRAVQQVSTMSRVTTYGSTLALGRRSSM